MSIGIQEREWIDRVGWTSVTGVLSTLPVAYLWGCWLAIELFRVSPRGNVGLILFSILGSVPLSALSGAYGSRYWWLVTALNVGTLLFIGLRLH